MVRMRAIRLIIWRITFFRKVWYIIPAELVVGQGSIALYPNLKGAKYGPYKEAWHLLREQDRRRGGAMEFRLRRYSLDDDDWSGFQWERGFCECCGAGLERAPSNIIVRYALAPLLRSAPRTAPTGDRSDDSSAAPGRTAFTMWPPPA